MASITSIAAPGPAAATPAAPTAGGIIDIGDPTKMPDHDVSFSDVLSVLNPLQYIPVVGGIYRAITGDSAPQAAQVLVGTLIGGPLGLVASAANAIVEQSTGKDVEQHALAMLLPQDDAPPANPQNQRYAAATPAPAASAPPSSVAAVSPEPAPAQTAPTTPQPVTSAALPATPDAAAPPAQPQAQPAAATASQPTATLLPHPPSGAAPPAAAAMAMGSPVRPAGAGYTLADYRTFAGTGVPPPPNGNVQRTALVPLQTTLPLPNDVTHAPVVAAVVHTPGSVAAPAPTAAAAAPSDQPQDTWISQAMMHGLDRYRDMMRQQEQGQQQGQQNQQPGS